MATKTLKAYTVILLLPDYVADDFGDTRLEQVYALTPSAAARTAASQAARKAADSARADDYAVKYVFEGLLKDARR